MVPMFMRVLARDPLAADVHPAFEIVKQAAVAFVRRQCIAAVLDEAQHVVEIGTRERGIRGGGAYLGEHRIGVERRGAGHAKQVLGEHVEPAGPRRIAVEFARRDAGDRRGAFQNLEPVGGDENGLRGFVHAVVGATDPLQQARHAFRRADLDDLIDAAPVDAEVERGGRDDRAQLPGGHRRLDAAALLDLQTAVVQPDRQRRVVEAPQRLEHQLRLGAGVDEHDRRAGGADARHHLRRRLEAHVAGPGERTVRHHDRNFRRRAVGGGDDPRGAEPGAQRPGVRGGRRQPGATGGGSQVGKARHAEGQLVAALRAGKRVHLVDDDRGEAPEHPGRIVERQHDRQALGRRQQDVRRLLALAGAAVLRRVAGAGLDRDAEPHLGHRRIEVAGDVDRERLQRADIERVDAGARAGVQVDERGQEPGKRLAAAGRRGEQHQLARFGGGQHLQLMRPRRPAPRGKPAGEGFR